MRFLNANIDAVLPTANEKRFSKLLMVCSHSGEVVSIMTRSTFCTSDEVVLFFGNELVNANRIAKKKAILFERKI